MIASHALLMFVLATFIAGSTTASAPAPARSDRVSQTSPPHDAADDVVDVASSGDGLVLRGAMSASESQILTGGRFRLAGKLTAVAEECPDDESSVNAGAFQLCEEDAGALLREKSGPFEQLAAMLGQWGWCEGVPLGDSCEGDLDRDGLVGPADLRLLLSNW